MHIRVASLCFIVLFLEGYDITSMSYAIPSLTEVWHAKPPRFTTALTAGSFGLLFGALGAGLLGDRLGRKPVLIGWLLVRPVLAAYGVQYRAGVTRRVPLFDRSRPWWRHSNRDCARDRLCTSPQSQAARNPDERRHIGRQYGRRLYRGASRPIDGWERYSWSAACCRSWSPRC